MIDTWRYVVELRKESYYKLSQSFLCGLFIILCFYSFLQEISRRLFSREIRISLDNFSSRQFASDVRSWRVINTKREGNIKRKDIRILQRQHMQLSSCIRDTPASFILCCILDRPSKKLKPPHRFSCRFSSIVLAATFKRSLHSVIPSSLTLTIFVMYFFVTTFVFISFFFFTVYFLFKVEQSYSARILIPHEMFKSTFFLYKM